MKSHTPVPAALLLIFLMAVLAGCSPRKAHLEEVEAWHERRVASLAAPDGWLSLTGLYWLTPGENRFGSDPTNDLVFPDSTVPGYLGSFYLIDDSVSVRLAPESGVETDIKADSFPVVTDFYESPTMFTYGSHSWYVIDREGQIGVRLRDAEAQARQAFSGIERYPVDLAWRVSGRFVWFDHPRKMEVPTVLNTPATLMTPGAVEFEVHGETQRLEVVGEPDSRRFWIIFADPTNRTTTYPAGRYVYIDAPKEDGSVVIDFNMSYSPPCAFSEYATCPFPPPQNRLKVPIEAGEKRYRVPEMIDA